MINQQLNRFATHENSAYPQLWRGCVGAWCPSLGPSGSRLHDYSRRNNWGTLLNMDPATDWVIDGGQYALDFDGTNDSVNVGRPPIIDNLVDDFTVSVWCKPTGSFVNFRNVIGKATSAGQFGIIVFSDGTWYSQFGTATGILAGTLTLNRWFFLAYTLKAGAVVNYQNGAVVSTGSNTTTTIAVDFEIGRDTTNNRNWLGLIDDIKVYNRALSAAEIRQLWRIDRGGVFTPRTRARATPEQSAATTNRRRRIICGSNC